MRPRLDRTEPIRHWGNLANRAQAESGIIHEREPASDLAHAVATGYRVISEYLEQGQNFARALTGDQDVMFGRKPTAAAPRPSPSVQAPESATQPTLRRFILDVRSARPTRSEIELVQAPPSNSLLLAESLRSSSGKSIIDARAITVDAGDGSLAIRIAIRARQRRDLYLGRLIDQRTGATVLRISLQIF
jgi:hypothetical protein